MASVAIRSLHHAAEVLTDRREQEEVLQIFDKINKETGWRIGFVYKELKERWGWNEEPSPQQFAQTHTGAKQAQETQRQLQEQAQAAQQNMQQLQQGFDFAQQQQSNSMPPNMQQMPNQAPQQPPPQTMQPTPQQQQTNTPMKRPPAGIPNPMYAKADFSLPQHPYQNFYVPAAAAAGGFAGNAQGGGTYYNF